MVVVCIGGGAGMVSSFIPFRYVVGEPLIKGGSASDWLF